MIYISWTMFFLMLNDGVLGARILNCPKSDIKFNKVIGLSPVILDKQQILYKLKPNETVRPITMDCLTLCLTNETCQSFVLNYDKNECHWFEDDVTEVNRGTRMDVDNDAAWFVKVCLKHEKDCNKLWIFERVRGATLIGNDTKVLPTNMSKTECEQKCLDETEFRCKSAKFKARFDYEMPENNETLGHCILSDTDRHLMSNAYRVSTYDDYYLENQCSNNHLQEESSSSDYCAYEEYEDVVLRHSDLTFLGESKEDCEKHCEECKGFHCRGYSILQQQDTNICLLHSEDTKLRGPRLLVPSERSFYYEKATCLNISVSCSDSMMTISYRPEMNFHGKLYMQGYSEKPECYVVGQGKYRVVNLKLPLLTGQCGIVKADSVTNRTLLAGTLIIQYNPFIQTQSDRILRVGCIFGNESKVVVGTGVNISSNLPNKGSTLVNTPTNATLTPIVEMRVVDLKTQRETTDTQIGQELQLIIELKEKTNTLDFWVSHLVAMTEKGDESIFLLDDRGCPPNLNIFPPLTKVSTNSTRKLSATFQAFKFASSPVVRFSVIIQFCNDECPPINCNGNIKSYGRRKREISSHIIETVNGQKIVRANLPDNQIMSGSSISRVTNQMPLEYVMIVRDSSSQPDRLVVGNNDGKVLVAGYNYMTNEVCMDYSLVIGLILTWIIVQLLFIIASVIMVKKYKKQYKEEYTRASLEDLHKNFGLGFSNLESRRVRWADNDDNIM